MTPPHLDEETIAELADGRPATGDESAHLEGCRSCLAAYAEAVEVVSEWRESEGSSAPLVAKPRRGSAWRIAAPLAVAALLAFVVWFGRPGPRSDYVPEQELLRAAARWSSAGFVLPGAPESDSESGYRSGAPDPTSLDRTIAALDRRWIEQPSASVGYWRAAALLATGQSAAAWEATSEALARFPESEDLLVLRAAIAYRDGRDDEARRDLAEVVRRDSSHAVARANLEFLEEQP
ncbi:MAG: hypothetical protein KC591_04495 [Gemmatimonadetes bacterium]|nr:hypothetical protein [Gemmatimonadota bacterium]